MFTIVGLTSLYCSLSVLSSLTSNLLPLKLDTLRDNTSPILKPKFACNDNARAICVFGVNVFSFPSSR